MNNTQYMKFIHSTLYISESFLSFYCLSSPQTIKSLSNEQVKTNINVYSVTFALIINVMQDSQVEI